MIYAVTTLGRVSKAIASLHVVSDHGVLNIFIHVFQDERYVILAGYADLLIHDGVLVAFIMPKR